MRELLTKNDLTLASEAFALRITIRFATMLIIAGAVLIAIVKLT